MTRILFACSLLFLLMPSVSQAQAQACVRGVPLSCDVVNAGARAAYAALNESRRLGREVDTARQVVAEGDRICLLQYLLTGGEQVRFTIERHSCVTQEGAYQMRADGEVTSGMRTQMSNTIRALMSDPNSWQRFNEEVLATAQGFATVQSLIRHPQYQTTRARILELVLRRDVVFINQNHPDGMFTQ